MEHGDAQRIGIFHFVNECLIPDWIKCFLFNAGAICICILVRKVSNWSGDKIYNMFIKVILSRTQCS